MNEAIYYPGFGEWNRGKCRSCMIHDLEKREKWKIILMKEGKTGIYMWASCKQIASKIKGE